MKMPTKKYGVYYWDTFDNDTSLVGEENTIAKATKFVKTQYRVRRDGADQVDIVTRDGGIVKSFKVG